MATRQHYTRAALARRLVGGALHSPWITPHELGMSLEDDPDLLEEMHGIAELAVEAGRLEWVAPWFYVVVPVAHPTIWFPALMHWMGSPWYAGLLTAASRYGAVPVSFSEFQVVTPAPGPLRESLRELGHWKLRFLAASDFDPSSIRPLHFESGSLPVSSPERTALDLVRYYPFAGGLSLSTSILLRLAHQISAPALRRLLPGAPTADLQRLGYLLERGGTARLADLIHAGLRRRRASVITLAPDRPAGGRLHRRWNLRINAEPEPE